MPKITYITIPGDLPLVNEIEPAETAKAAMLRPTKHFEIVTADNPDMIKTLELQQQFIEAKLVELPDDTTAQQCELKKKEWIKEFQKSLSEKAYQEQLELIKKIENQGIVTHKIVEGKGKLETAEFAYYTDQIFATDTGQYYDKNGILHFIAASFKNPQRWGEEKLAIEQAENLGATVQTLVSKTGEKLKFEGGDIRQMIGKKLFFIGQGHRSDPETSKEIAKMSGYWVVPIQLLQPQFYHLDCCFLPLPCDAAVIYEGEYEQDHNGQNVLDASGWPKLIPGTETMTAESRALIRAIYPNDKLVLISKQEALAYATNGVVLQNHKTNQFKLFVNGQREEGEQHNEVQELMNKKISLTAEHLKQIKTVTQGQMDIIETPYSTMHGSGGSVRCTVLELACKIEALTPHKGSKYYFSTQVDRLETRLGKEKFQFFQAENMSGAETSKIEVKEAKQLKRSLSFSGCS